MRKKRVRIIIKCLYCRKHEAQLSFCGVSGLTTSIRRKDLPFSLFFVF